MAWFADLSPCDYLGADAAHTLRSIGWLERGQSYRTARVEQPIYLRLLELCRDPWQPFVAAGIHECQLCQYEPTASGGSNVFVPGNGFLYVCPQLITHYMNCHGYAPPDEFCAAVLACPAMRSNEYRRAILANGGQCLMRVAADRIEM